MSQPTVTKDEIILENRLVSNVFSKEMHSMKQPDNQPEKS
jgi:hypothetical protein